MPQGTKLNIKSKDRDIILFTKIGIAFNTFGTTFCQYSKFYKKKKLSTSHVKNIIQKFYPKFFIQNVHDLFFVTLYID